MLPTYLPVVIVYCTLYYILGFIDFKTLVINITTLSFWLHTSYRFDWYIPALIALYLVSPIILQIFSKKETNKSKYYIISICILISIFLSIIIMNSKISYLLIFTSRIPIFCIGILIGYWSYTNKNINTTNLLLDILMFIIGFISLIICIKYFGNYLWSYGLWWWPFIIITPPLCIIICILLDFIFNRGITKFKFIKFCGNHSLELYLFHQRILNLLADKLINLLGDKFIMNLICITITFIMAYLWKKILSFICNLNIKKKLQIKENL